MKKETATFASLLREFEYHFDARTVFDDFLTMTLCSFSLNPATGKSFDEDLYMETINKYKENKLRHHFPKLLSCLVLEMEELIISRECPDVLGSFYEQNLYRKGTAQYFTPWPICWFMASCLAGEAHDESEPRRLRILDPCCGSGRMLIAGAHNQGREHEYYGIDVDLSCVRMTALNLFLNGVFNGEVMWANALDPNDFRMSYRLSFLPFGIFRITEKENSHLWQLNQNTFQKKAQQEPPPFREKKLWEKLDDGSGDSQLQLF